MLLHLCNFAAVSEAVTLVWWDRRHRVPIPVPCNGWAVTGVIQAVTLAETRCKSYNVDTEYEWMDTLICERMYMSSVADRRSFCLPAEMIPIKPFFGAGL